MEQASNIIIYTTEDGLAKIETTFDGDTVWLSIDQMAELFQRDRSVIGKHVRNIFKEGELQKESVWAKFAYTAADGKTYDVDYYNLDVIISVGYRVKSKRSTQFRILRQPSTEILSGCPLTRWRNYFSEIEVSSVSMSEIFSRKANCRKNQCGQNLPTLRLTEKPMM